MDDYKRRTVDDVKGATLNGAVQSLAFLIPFTEVLSWILGTCFRSFAVSKTTFGKIL
jgi:hypothetical protein